MCKRFRHLSVLMNKLPLLSFVSFTLFGMASPSSAILITDVGINVTNDGSALVADVPQATLPNQNPSSQFAWLQSLVAEPYNTIASASLPEPTGNPSAPDIQDDSASNNGNYSLVDGMSYYFVSHYGKSNTAWFIASADGSETYGMPNQASDFGGAGKGLSNVRIWKVNVPDGGITLMLLGVGITGLALLRRRLT